MLDGTYRIHTSREGNVVNSLDLRVVLWERKRDFSANIELVLSDLHQGRSLKSILDCRKVRESTHPLERGHNLEWHPVVLLRNKSE